MVLRPASWAAVLLLGLASAGLAGAQAPQPTTDPASIAPFFDGVTDAESLKRIVNGRLTAARVVLAQLTSARPGRTAEQTLRTYDDIQVHISSAKELSYVVRQLHPDAAMRAMAETLVQSVEAFETEVALAPRPTTRWRD